jgi:hypothetical protein
LKDKLFGLKRVISDKKSTYLCVTPTKSQNKPEEPQTRREFEHKAFMANQPQEQVCMSIAQSSPSNRSELDMSPYLI